MVHLTILQDSREQKPWTFDNQDATVKEATLTTGDYTLEEFCEPTDGYNTFEPSYCVERKSGDDLVSSLTRDRERFKREIKRAEDWPCPLRVIIEEHRETVGKERDFMQYRNVSPNAIFGTIESWERWHNVEFRWAGNRERAQQQTFDALSERLRTHLVSSD